jgi:hypothetical protein
MKKILVFTTCAALQVFAASAYADQSYCREYTQTFTIGNSTQKGYGTACLQPDGSWEIQTPAAVTQAAPSEVVVEQQPITYVVRDSRTYFVPSRPFRDEIIIRDYPHGGHHHGRW